MNDFNFSPDAMAEFMDRIKKDKKMANKIYSLIDNPILNCLYIEGHLFIHFFFFPKLQIKETNADISKTETVTISHISQIGSAIMLASAALIINKNGIANKKVIPKAISFRAFPMRIKIANIIHKNTMVMIAITAPMENTSFVFNIRLNTNKYGMVKILKDIKLTATPLFPNKISGKSKSQAYRTEQAGISDHVNWPDMAILQIKHTMIPRKSAAEKRMEIILCFVTLVSSFRFSATKFSSAFFSKFSPSTFVPLNRSFAVISKISQSLSIMDESGILFPVSHLDTALSVIFNFSANCACVNFFSLRHLAINAPISIWFISTFPSLCNVCFA